MMQQMKRKREIRKEMMTTEIRVAIQELSVLQQQQVKVINPSSSVGVGVDVGIGIGRSDGVDASVVGGARDAGDTNNNIDHFPIRPFLSLSKLMIQLLDKIGPTMAVLRLDIHDNIQRLETQMELDPTTYSNMIMMLRKEAGEGNARKTDSCSRAILWLTRSLDFTASLLEKTTQVMMVDSSTMENIVDESYSITLKPWHGWISMAAYKVALKLLPDTHTFLSLLMDKGDDFNTLTQEVQSLLSLLLPYLETIHFLLRLYGLDQLKCK